MRPSQGRRGGFESRLPLKGSTCPVVNRGLYYGVPLIRLGAEIAQWSEQRFRKPQVGGSSPLLGSKIFQVHNGLDFFVFLI